MAQLRIVIHVHGGIVQEVFCSHAGAELTVVDWDADALSLNDHGVVEVPTTGGSSLVCVAQQPVLPLSQLAGTETEKAILAAQARGILAWQATPSRHAPRYVLFDFDADELAATKVYGSYEEAKQDAAVFDNVLILKLLTPSASQADNTPEPEIDGDSAAACPPILAKLTGVTSWEEVEGPRSGCGVDYWYVSADGRRAYINIDQDHMTISIDGQRIFDGSTSGADAEG